MPVRPLSGILAHSGLSGQRKFHEGRVEAWQAAKLLRGVSGTKQVFRPRRDGDVDHCLILTFVLVVTALRCVSNAAPSNKELIR